MGLVFLWRDYWETKHLNGKIREINYSKSEELHLLLEKGDKRDMQIMNRTVIEVYFSLCNTCLSETFVNS